MSKLCFDKEAILQPSEIWPSEPGSTNSPKLFGDFPPYTGAAAMIFGAAFGRSTIAILL